ncbi:MAG: transketolase family protein, partial [Actinobacteria bacterium]|nr:transketolase family protein [Actinomycetota bacterium]
TIEEHNIIGGLYSAVCEVLSNSYPKYVYPLAVPDIFTESGLPVELREKYGLSSCMITKKVLSTLEENN